METWTLGGKPVTFGCQRVRLLSGGPPARFEARPTFTDRSNSEIVYIE